jgi:hypothetical protein
VTVEQINQLGAYIAIGVLCLIIIGVVAIVILALRNSNRFTSGENDPDPSAYVDAASEGGSHFFNTNGTPMMPLSNFDSNGDPYGS